MVVLKCCGDGIDGGDCDDDGDNDDDDIVNSN